MGQNQDDIINLTALTKKIKLHLYLFSAHVFVNRKYNAENILLPVCKNISKKQKLCYLKVKQFFYQVYHQKQNVKT